MNLLRTDRKINKSKKEKTTEYLESLINIGPATKKRLNLIGITTSSQLKSFNPEAVYEKLKNAEGGKLDKCVLYQLRGAILNMPWWLCK